MELNYKDGGQIEVNIDCSYRANGHDIRTLVETDGFYRLGLQYSEVDECLVRLMSALEIYKTDTVIAAVGILFVLLVHRFQFHTNSFIGFINRLIAGDEKKIGMIALISFLNTNYERMITRYEQVKFNKTRTVVYDSNRVM